MLKEERGSVNDADGRAKGTEIFVAALCRSVTEDMIRKAFYSCGEILEIRLIKDHNGVSKGFGFVRFTTKDAAVKAQKEKNGYMMEGKKIVVALSSDRSSLFFGGLRKDWMPEEFEKMIGQAFEDVVSVDLAMPLTPGKFSQGKQEQNRGFAFVHFSGHAAAARAYRIGSKPEFYLKDNCHPIVDWAEKKAELDPEEMAKIKVAFVTNLPRDANEDFLQRLFEPFGKLERVALSWKNNAPVGFVHYANRAELDKAIKELNGKLVKGPENGPKFELKVCVSRTILTARKHTREESHEKKYGAANEYNSSKQSIHLPHLDVQKEKVRRVDNQVEDTGINDPYEAAVISLPSSIMSRLLRIFRLGIATRYDIDIRCLDRLKDLPESAAVGVLDEFLSSGPVGHAKGAYLASLIAKHQNEKLAASHESLSYLGRSLDSAPSEADFLKERASTYASSYGHIFSRPAVTPSFRYDVSPVEKASHYWSSISSEPIYARSGLTSLADPPPALSSGDAASSPQYGSIRHDLRLASSSTERKNHGFRFDPFTGVPYKFDPFTGEPIQHDTFPTHSVSR